MLGTGDALTVQLFWLGGALTVGALVASQLGWRHRLFIAFLYTLLVVFLSLGTFWSLIVSKYPSLSFKIPEATWFLLITILVLFICYRTSKSVVLEERDVINKAPDLFRERLFKAAVFEGTSARPPVLRFTSLKAQLRIDIFIDVSVYYSGVLGGGNGWSEPRRIFISDLLNVYKGQTVTQQIFSKTTLNGTDVWKFGPSNENSDIVNPAAGYRCRIVLLPSSLEDQERYVYFYACRKDLTQPPFVIGEHLLGHMFSWEGGEEKAADAETLFSHS